MGEEIKRVSKEERLKLLDKTITESTKQFGQGIIRIGNVKLEVPIICSSGSLKLDTILGVGGIPKGRVIEIFGPESSGKTTLALHIMREAQKKDGLVAFIDAEHALDPIWASNIGVTMDEVTLSQPDYGEQALELLENLIDSNSIDVIVVDSVAALVPKAEIEGEMGDQQMGLQARLMSKAMRKLIAKVNKSSCTVVFINQIRANIGGYGLNEVTSGGNALKFYSTIRIEVRNPKGDADTSDEGGLVSALLSVKVVKNKVAAPFKKTRIQLDTGKYGKYGFNVKREVLDLAVEFDIIKKGGAWFTYKDMRWQGSKNVLREFDGNENLYQEIRKEVMIKLNETNSYAIGNELIEEVENKENKKASVKEEVKRGKK